MAATEKASTSLKAESGEAERVAESVEFGSVYFNPLPVPTTLWVVGPRRVLVTAASRSCALVSKLR